MIDLPREPNPGEDLDASWGIRVVRALRALLPSGGPGVHVSTGPTGTTISATAPAQDRPGFGQKTDTAVADADAAAPQLRSVEVREAAAATGEGTTPAAEAGTEATPAVPAALQLHDFDDAAPEGCGGVSATVTVPEGGGKCDVEFAMPGDTDPASGDITFAARRIDPETGARSLVWLKLGVKPGEEEGDEGEEGGEEKDECSQADDEAFPSDIEGDSASGGSQGWVGKEDNWDEKPFPSDTDNTDGPSPEDSERFPSKIGPCW